jgi:hypothetical protein
VSLFAPNSSFAAKSKLEPGEAIIKIRKNSNEAVFGGKRKVNLGGIVLVNGEADPKLICGSGDTIVTAIDEEALNLTFIDDFRPGGTIKAVLGEETATLIIDKIVINVNKAGVEFAKVLFQEDQADQEILGEEGEVLVDNDISKAKGSIDFACPNEGQENFFGGGSIGSIDGLSPGQSISFVRGFSIPTDITVRGAGSGWAGTGSILNINGGNGNCSFPIGANLTRTCHVGAGTFQIKVRNSSVSSRFSRGDVRFFN